MWWVLRHDRVSVQGNRCREGMKAPEREASVLLEQHDDTKGYPDINRERKRERGKDEPLN